MGMSIEAGYNWMDCNPSGEEPLQRIAGTVFDNECAWMADRSYENEAKLESMTLAYSEQLPNLFKQLEILMAVKADSISIFDEFDTTFKSYIRGALIAINALEATPPRGPVVDLNSSYLERLSELDMIDLEHWMISMKAYTAQHTEQLRGFIRLQYGWLDEPMHAKTAMLAGAQNAYILLVHSKNCYERELELSWELRDLDWLDQTLSNE